MTDFERSVLTEILAEMRGDKSYTEIVGHSHDVLREVLERLVHVKDEYCHHCGGYPDIKEPPIKPACANE